jgi:hypothetical protein
MDLVKRLLIACASFAEAQIPEEQIKTTIKYIMGGRDYVARVARAHSEGFTFLPPFDRQWQPRPMNTLDRFLSGDWRKCSWEAYILKEKSNGGPKVSLKRSVILSFFGALLADIALSFIVWLLLMMGISIFDLESKLGIHVDPSGLLIGAFVIMFVLLFSGFLVFIRPKKSKLQT